MQNIPSVVATVTGSTASLGPIKFEIQLQLSNALSDAGICEIKPEHIKIERSELPPENPNVYTINVVVKTDPLRQFTAPNTSDAEALILQVLPGQFESCAVNITAA